MVIRCPRCGLELGCEFLAHLEHNDDGSHYVVTET